MPLRHDEIEEVRAIVREELTRAMHKATRPVTEKVATPVKKLEAVAKKTEPKADK